MLKDAIGQELRILSRQVTLGQWEAVRGFSGPWKLSPCKRLAAPGAATFDPTGVSSRQPVPPNRQRAEDHDSDPMIFWTH